ncbi:FtsW/RodA/SpoVE family cell cycle protein [Catenisphaera adipataccumulans]|jgi:cell division protein FtsW|uniref:Probable peptidoglycan glycosyltransferase FtsW n=1 Tax=Catenisphaera adipataccumulans TaxID=700500 RepID=A0A7W8FWL1_9FIRM|nr:FtsW/RodA/SpoVE family cell cycle protein [Catenisphaera adipataccumulans]MBB5182032.1 cell division protein FtsW [Catenisphaera adipataccumulans]
MPKKKNRSLLRIIQLRPKSDGYITLSVLALMVFGSLMIVSTDMGETGTAPLVVLMNIVKQVIFMAVGYGVMCACSKWFSFRRFAFWQYGFMVVLFLLTAATFLFSASGGSQAWIRLPGGITIQPSEFVKSYMIAVVAAALYQGKRKKGLLNHPGRLFRFPLIVMGVFGLLILAQRDIGTLVILLMIFLTCLLIPSVPSLKVMQKHIKRLLAAGICLAILLFGVTDIGTNIIAQTPFSHIATRVANAKNPYNDIYGEGYQPANSLYGIASSNIIGRGLGNSSRKYGYLTQADNDYILAIVIEETGIFGLAYIIFFYIAILSRLFHYAMVTNDTGYRVILGGTAMYLFMHFFLNVGGVACFIPFTGVPLLFISSGGSSLIGICAAMGISQNCISKIRRREEE